MLTATIVAGFGSNAKWGCFALVWVRPVPLEVGLLVFVVSFWVPWVCFGVGFAKFWGFYHFLPLVFFTEIGFDLGVTTFYHLRKKVVNYLVTVFWG